MTDNPVEGVVVVRRFPLVFPEIGINCNKTLRNLKDWEYGGEKPRSRLIAVREAGHKTTEAKRLRR